jgi:hypothetical protein
MNSSVNYNNRQDEETDAVLTAFVQAQAAPSGADLSEWTARYPSQARDLARLAAQAWTGEERETAAPDSTARCRAIGLAALRTFRAEPKTAQVITFSASAAPVSSLLAAAEAAGKEADEVASLLDLPSALFWKLHRRLIAPDSVPRALVASLAEAVNRTTDEIAAYLRMPPQMATGASFRSDDAPSLGQQESFADALQTEPEATDASRRRWLRGAE